MNNPPDGYDTYYADKLWSLLPAIYRTLDPPTPDGTSGPLFELVNRIGAQVAVVRRSIDRMWQDQSIETCDDWVIPYIGDLLGVEVPALGQRVAVAKAIYYRRRKGTLPLLEEMAGDLTGWDTKAVPFFRRLARSRHGLDPALGWPLSRTDASGPSLRVAQSLIGAITGTPVGGTADLRHAYGASRAHTAFDEFAHTADVRRNLERTGWYEPSRLGVFLFRADSVEVDGVCPVADSRSNEFTFDPTGRDVPLFAASTRTYGAGARFPAEHDLPVPIDELLLRSALAELVPNSLRLYEGTTLVPTARVRAELATKPEKGAPIYSVDPVRGRFRVSSAVNAPILVGYHYASSVNVGAGGYDRRVGGHPFPTCEPIRQFSGGGAIAVPVVGPGASASAVVGGTLEILDSRTYFSVPNLRIGDAPPNRLILRAANEARPVLRPRRGSNWETFHVDGSVDENGFGSRLDIDGIFLCGPELRLSGAFEEVVLSSTTLDPGALAPASPEHFATAIDGQPLRATRLTISGQIRRLVVDRCILGPVHVRGRKALVEQLEIRDSIVDSVGTSPAIALDTGVCHVLRSTLFGEVNVHRLEATSSLFVGRVEVADLTEGCTRFSAFPENSRVPRPYECVALATRPPFASRSFGQPGYAELLPTADSAITSGAEDGSEMGALSRARIPLKRRALRAHFEAFAPAGLAPVFIEVT